MASDIHSYFEVRHGPDEPWQLAHRPRVDDDGRYDVPVEAQPFRGQASSTFIAVLTGMVSRRADLDYGRLTPILPAGRSPTRDLGPELSRIFAGWQGAASGPFSLRVSDLERVDWDQPVYASDGSCQPLEAYAPLAHDALARMHRLAPGGRTFDIRLVFWID